MEQKDKKLKIQSKFWLDLGDEVIFGLGRIKIFQAIEETGSMSQAAALLGMSYRAAWGKVKATEDRLQMSLVERQQGNRRQGTILTPAGKELLTAYLEFQTKAHEQIDALFEERLAKVLDHLNEKHPEQKMSTDEK